jgi:hypothetical protein
MYFSVLLLNAAATSRVCRNPTQSESEFFIFIHRKAPPWRPSKRAKDIEKLYFIIPATFELVEIGGHGETE